MNVILIIADTMRRDHLGLYGNQTVRTPHLDRLASMSYVFENAYCANFPTVPNRLDVMTGRFTLTQWGWQPLPREAVVISQVLSGAGKLTQMIVDTPHILQSGFGFDRGFAGWEWVRGQENDRLRTSPRQVTLPAAPEKLRSPHGAVTQHLRNISTRRSEADCFCARTMQAACDWLEENRGEQFFLYLDTFDPHEPWDAPQWYVDLYDPGYEGDEVSYPVYGPADYLSEAELRHMRALYAAEVTLVDAWVGRLLGKVEQLGLMDDTAIVYTTDHGFYHGEHNLTGKTIILEHCHADTPLYSEVARIPLMVYVPGTPGGRVQAYAQPPDYMPTVLDLMNVEPPDTVQGTSLVPVMRGEQRMTRPFAISTPSLNVSPSGGRPTTITRGEWSLIYWGDPDGDLMAHLTRNVDGVERPAGVPTDSVPEPELYHLPTDPVQRYNVYAENRDIATRLHSEHVRFLEGLGMDEQFLRHRRRLDRSQAQGGLFG